jgi:hypothetical protein
MEIFPMIELILLGAAAVSIATLAASPRCQPGSGSVRDKSALGQEADDHTAVVHFARMSFALPVRGLERLESQIIVLTV